MSAGIAGTPSPTGAHHGPVAADTAEAAAAAVANQVTGLVSVTQMAGPVAGKCHWHRGTAIGLNSTDRAALAWLIADAIMQARCGASPALQTWRTAALSGAKLIGKERAVVSAFIVSVFGVPGAAKSEDHVQGHVAEWLWYLNAIETVHAARSVALVDPPKFNVTEPGADGFVVFSDNTSGETFFRLWEIKKHSGTTPVSQTVTIAYAQLKKNAMRYLAQQTSVHSLKPGAVGDLCKQLADFWVDEHQRAGAGIGVASNSASPPNRCFSTMGKQFPGFDRAGQLEGLLLAIENLDQLALDVRGYLWTVL